MSDDDSVLSGTFGIVGGVLLAVCLLPQVFQTIRTKETSDLSYGWLFIYLLGLTFTFLYLFLINATIGWASIVVEICFAILLVLLKFFLERGKKAASNIDPAPPTTTPLLPTPAPAAAPSTAGNIKQQHERMEQRARTVRLKVSVNSNGPTDSDCVPLEVRVNDESRHNGINVELERQAKSNSSFAGQQELNAEMKMNECSE